MDVDRVASRRERSEERYRAGSPVREFTEGSLDDSEDYEKDKSRESSKHRSKDKKKSRREDKDHRSRDRDRSKPKDELKERDPEKNLEKERSSVKEKKKEDKEEHEKDRLKDKVKEKDTDKDKHRGKDHDIDEKDRGRKRDRERERDEEPEGKRVREKERGKEKSKDKEEREKEKAKDRDRGKDREREKEKERTRDRERERDHEKSKEKVLLDREQAKDISRDRDRDLDHDKERTRDKEKVGRRNRDDQDHSKDGGRDVKAKAEGDGNRERETTELGHMASDKEGAGHVKRADYVGDLSVDPSQSRMDVAERILRIKEERMKRSSEGASEILSWVSKSRKLEEKRNSEKEKALRRSKMFEEQDNVDEDDNMYSKESTDSLAGVKVLHGVDKVLEGGAVVLTLKDQDILANGDLNEDVDMLENVEIGEQKRRSEAYKASKKSAGVYVDKFNDGTGEEKKMLPQYDDPTEEEGVVLDAAGRFTGEAEKKLEELRKRLQGPVKIQAEDLSSSAKISSDYYTPEEMLQFRKPKKKKSLRKKEKLDLDALEAEARSTGLGTSDLGSRNDNKRQAAKEEEERSEVERRKSAYQTAFAKADEASKALRMEQAVNPAIEDSDTMVFADDAEDLQKSLEKARKLALKKQSEKALAGPEAVARLASSSINNKATDAQDSNSGDASDNKVVFTEMEEFVWGLQLDEEAQRSYQEDVFMEEDEAPKAFEEQKDETGGWTDVVNPINDEQPKSEDKEVVVPDETLHEVPVGKGLSGVLQLLKERGTLKESIDWGGRNMDKKKSKLVGIYDEDGPKKIHMDKKKGKLVDETPREIHLERTDEFGRILTPKQAFRLLSHKFHGKGPGKMKQEKRLKQYQDELKLKQMTSSDVFPQSVGKMMDAQAQLKSPYLVLSGNVKPGQTSDPRSGFATVEKEVPGSLTPMLGDKKVEHFLGIKRKVEHGSSGTPKKPKT